MPDTNQDDLVPRNDYERALVKAAEDKLKAEIAKAKHIDHPAVPFDDLREFDVNTNKLPATPQTNQPPLTLGNGEMPLQVPEAPPGMFGSLTSGFFAAIQAGIAAAQQAAATFLKLSDAQNEAAQAARENSTNAAPANIPTNGVPGVAPLPAGTPANSGTDGNGPFPAPAPTTNSPSAPLFPGANPSAGAGASSQLGAGDDFAGAVAAQTQSFQSSGDRLRAAVEQNTFMTNSLFVRMLDVMDMQNRKLSDLDRKTSELGNQIKSLKNP